MLESCTCHVVPLAQLIVNPFGLCVEDGDSSKRFCCEELRLVFPTRYTSLHVCATLATRRFAVFLPQPVFASSCLLLAMLFYQLQGPLFSSWVLGSLPWLFLTSSRSALSLMGPWVPSLAVFILVMLALSCAKHWRRDPAGTTHVCEALFPRASRPLRSYTLALLCRRGQMVREANLLVARLRFLTLAAIAAFS